MAAKTANVLARVEPEVKERAESVLAQLGVPASTVINMLYKQIILTQSIPFPLSLPTGLPVREEMDADTFHAMMQAGMQEALADRSLPAADAFAQLRQTLR